MSFGNIEVGIFYLKRLELYKREKPFEIFIRIPISAPDQRSKNTEFESRLTPLFDIRGSERQFNLDDHGFAVRRFDVALPSLEEIQQEFLKEHYFPEVERFVKREVGGVDRLSFFGFRLRSGAIQMKKNQVIDLGNKMMWARPAPIVHIDQSPAAAVGRVRALFKDDAPQLLRGRVRIVNVWKPLRGPVEDYPLTICDASTMPLSDLERSDQIRGKYAGETYYGHFNENQKWYYLSQQREDEAYLMKIFDSDESVRAKYCPHAAFKHPKARGGLPTRTSIEVRALVFTYAKNS